MEKLGVLLCGCGNTGRLIAKEIVNHGGVLTAIVDEDPRLLGSVIQGVAVTDDIEAVLRDNTAEIAVISTGGGLAAVTPLAKRCLTRGLNVITTSEEAIYPYSTEPSLTASLDALAREHHCTMTASGFQDCFWLYAVANFASSCSRIDRIRGRLCYNVDEYGVSLAADHGVGLSVNEFKERFTKDFTPSYLWNSSELLCAKLGWGVEEQKQKCVPYVYHEPIYSAALGKTIAKGHCVGMSTVVTTITKFGGVIETEAIGKIYTKNDKDICAWSFTGEPALSFEVKSPQTLKHTAASLVNRIPQVINAAPGYMTIDRLGENEYLTFPMGFYKNSR